MSVRLARPVVSPSILLQGRSDVKPVRLARAGDEEFPHRSPRCLQHAALPWCSLRRRDAGSAINAPLELCKTNGNHRTGRSAFAARRPSLLRLHVRYVGIRYTSIRYSGYRYSSPRRCGEWHGESPRRSPCEFRQMLDEPDFSGQNTAFEDLATSIGDSDD